METLQQEPSSDCLKNQLSQENLTKDSLHCSFYCPSVVNNFPGKDLYKAKLNTEIFKDCIFELDNSNVNITTSNSDEKNISKIDKKKEIVQKKEVTVDSLMESVDLSDLTFSCNDFFLGECNCFEQASQLVDPTLKDSESTPFSFNNSDSVQLFRFSLTESVEDNLTNLYKYSDNLFNKEKSNKCDRLICGNESAIKNEHYNLYRVFELFDSNANLNKETKKNDTVQCKVQNKPTEKKNEKRIISGQIKKGRRYLPHFKQKVLEYAKNHTFRQTASNFKINCNTITEWSRESKRLSLQCKNTSLPGSDYKNYKTDVNGTPESKTEIILLNDVISFETDLSEHSFKNIEDDLPSVDLKPDERFIKWVEMKRLQKKQLLRQEVYYIAKCCLKRYSVSQDKPSWFVMWFKRFSQALKNSIKTNVNTEKYIKYPNNFKLEVALYARIFTKNSAARVFNVPRRRMFDWFNYLHPVEDSFIPLGKNKTENVSEKEFFFESKKDKNKNKIYSELHLWYQKKFLNGFRPTSYEIKEKGKEIFSSHGLTGVKFSDGWLQKFCQKKNIKLRHSEDDRLLLWVLSQLDNNVTLSHQEITDMSSSLIGKKKFKGSKGWTLRFLKRHRNLLQYYPSVQDKLPQIVQEKLNCFWDNFKQNLSVLKIEPGNIGCMDEIPLSFNYLEEGKSTSLPLLRKSGFENCHGVVIMSALSSGRILPPAVVFKGTGGKQLLSNHNIDILILYQEKGLVTVDILETWFKDIWLGCISNPNILVADSFQPHCSVQLKQLLTKGNCFLHVIPEGCSSRIQPLGVEITPLFKETIKKQWKEFLSTSNLGSPNMMRRYRCPDQDRILDWIQSAYQEITRNPDSIISSFRTTGLLQ